MNYLTTIALLFGSFLSFSQGSFIHLESNHLSKKTTEYFGSLEDKTKSGKVEDVHFINFNPTITFNGLNDYLKVNEEIPELTQMTVFTVFMPSEITEETFDIWKIQSENSSLSMTNVLAENSSSQLSYSGIENGKPSIHTYTQYFRVGANEYSNGDTYIAWGKNEQQNNALFKGAIAELIAYDKILTPNDRSKIISSLAIKYGISLKAEQNYVASDNQIIWDAINDKSYNNQITGIGRDDELKLYQKQSTSSDNPDFLTIGVDAIQESNEKNEGIIQDGYFMLWGDNNQALKQTTTEQTENMLSVLERKWLMNVSGNTADDVNTQVKIDASTMLNDSIQSYLLVIDESGQGDFIKQQTRFLYPSTISEDGMIIYDNVQWDKDGSGKDVFSFKIDDRGDLPQLSEELALNPNSHIDQFTVFPTPTLDGNYKIYVQLEKIQDINIKVFDMTGKMLSSSDFKNEHVYQLEGLPIKTAGLYQITLFTNDEQVSKKMVVEN